MTDQISRRRARLLDCLLKFVRAIIAQCNSFDAECSFAAGRLSSAVCSAATGRCHPRLCSARRRLAVQLLCTQIYHPWYLIKPEEPGSPVKKRRRIALEALPVPQKCGREAVMSLAALTGCSTAGVEPSRTFAVCTTSQSSAVEYRAE